MAWKKHFFNLTNYFSFFYFTFFFFLFCKTNNFLIESTTMPSDHLRIKSIQINGYNLVIKSMGEGFPPVYPRSWEFSFSCIITDELGTVHTSTGICSSDWYHSSLIACGPYIVVAYIGCPPFGVPSDGVPVVMENGSVEYFAPISSYRIDGVRWTGEGAIDRGLILPGVGVYGAELHRSFWVGRGQRLHYDGAAFQFGTFIENYEDASDFVEIFQDVKEF